MAPTRTPPRSAGLPLHSGWDLARGRPRPALPAPWTPPNPDTGTVSDGALWYEEHLPAETVLWGMFALADSNNDGRKAKDLARAVPDDELLQLGGNAGVGSGLVRFLAEGAPA